MSTGNKLMTLADAMIHFQHYPLEQLRRTDEFIKSISGTGVSLGGFLSRRFNFTKPRLEFIESEDKARLDIRMHYGISGVTTLATLSRNVTILNKDNHCTIFVNDAKEPLSTLESSIDDLVGSKGYKLPEDIRNKPIESFLTENNKYGFELNVVVDTLSIYAELEINVQLDYIDLRDCTDDICTYLLENDIVTEDQRHAIYVLHEDSSSTPYAIRFKQHMGSQPISQYNKENDNV